MATITTRVQGDDAKGSPLTNVEVDNNFINLNTDKYESGDNVSLGTGTFSGQVSHSAAVKINNPDYGVYDGIGLVVDTAGSGKQTVAQFGSDSAGLFFTSSAPLITSGAYYNNGWIATKSTSTLLEIQNGDFRVQKGAGTVGEANTWTTLLDLGASSTIFNDTGEDIDFRVESDTNTHALFVQGSDGYVGINYDSPVSPLHINRSSNGNITAATLSNYDNTAGANQTTRLDFGLARNSGALKPYAGRIQVGKMDDWTNDDLRVDAYMSFSTYRNNALQEGMKLDHNGNLTINGDSRVKGQVRAAGWWGSPAASATGMAVEMGTSGGTGYILTYDRTNSDYGNLVFNVDQSINLDTINNGGEIRVNQGGKDTDFRVESDTRSHALYVDASKHGSVAIGTDTSTAWAGNGHLDFRYGGLGDDGSGYIDLTCNTYNSSGVVHNIKTGGLGGSLLRMAFGSITLRTTSTSTADAAAVFSNNYSANPTSNNFNEDSIDMDFRVESNNNSSMLFVDGGNDKVVIGDNSAPLSGATTPPFTLAVKDGITIGVDPYTFGYIGDGGNTGSVLIESNAYPASLGTQPTVTIKAATIGGSRRTHATFNSLEAVFNEDSANIDFRIESDDYSSAFFVDASTSRVGINLPSSSPQAYGLQIYGQGREFNDVIWDPYGSSTGPDPGNKDVATLYVESNSNAAANYGGSIGFRGKAGVTVDRVTFGTIAGVKENSTTDGSNSYSTQVKGCLDFYTTNTYTFSPNYGTRQVRRMRINSNGQVCIGRNAPVNTSRVTALAYSNSICYEATTNVDSYYPMWITNAAGSYVGYIYASSTGTSFSTSSDYRLKEDWQPMSGSIDRVKALNPVNFAWKADGSRVDGFLAHEAQEVVPEAVVGTKDAVDAEGNPAYQGIDQSKLVPLLTSALQEAIARIETLEAKVTALESN